jgi:hypothetical protein
MNASMKSRMVSSKSIKRLASIGEAVPDASGYEYAGGNTKGSLIPRFFRITGADAAADSLAIPRIGSFPPPAAARTAPTGVFFFALLVAIRIVSRPSIIVVPFVVVVVVARNAAIIIVILSRSFVRSFVLRFAGSVRPSVRASVCASQSKAQTQKNHRESRVSRFHR